MSGKVFILILLLASFLSGADKPAEQTEFPMSAQLRNLKPALFTDQVNLIIEDFFLDLEIGQENRNFNISEYISTAPKREANIFYISHSIITNLDLPPPAA